MKCYKELFTKEGLINNIGSYILLSIIFIYIVSYNIFLLIEYDIIVNKIDNLIDLKIQEQKNDDNIIEIKTKRNNNNKDNNKKEKVMDFILINNKKYISERLIPNYNDYIKEKNFDFNNLIFNGDLSNIFHNSKKYDSIIKLYLLDF